MKLEVIKQYKFAQPGVLLTVNPNTVEFNKNGALSDEASVFPEQAFEQLRTLYNRLLQLQTHYIVQVRQKSPENGDTYWADTNIKFADRKDLETNSDIMRQLLTEYNEAWRIVKVESISSVVREF
jgi:hypothetical protein